jgi:hypothetical protein
VALLALALCLAQDDFFETKIRPALAERCYGCHSADAPKLKGGLRLDTLDGLRRVAASGTILTAVRWADEDLRMPPKEKLPAAVLADFETWARQGARVPAPKGPRAAGPHWAFLPPQDISPPGPGHPIDAFISARLREKGLTMSPEADPRTLLRRAAYDLTGLPPAETEASYEEAVDRLLASPRYGERWGRHWLDVARYADTTDGAVNENTDHRMAHAAPYRDWVIRALNEDLPYDRFLLEQLAADLLPDGHLEATGFLTLGRRFNNNIHDIIDDRIDVLGRGLLGLTLSCARCHDHKFDPIPTADYYSLYGVFAASKEKVAPIGGAATEEHRRELKRRKDELAAFIRARGVEVQEHVRSRAGDYLAAVAGASPPGLNPLIVKEWRDYLAKSKLSLPAGEVPPEALRGPLALPLLRGDPSSVGHHFFDVPAGYEISSYKAKISCWETVGPGAPPRALALADAAPGKDPRVFKRGNPAVPGESVPRRFLAALSPEPRAPFAQGSGRLELARAVVGSPLAARVIVNRVWAQHFGAGLVTTPSDFGTRSDPPSHPALLDWLARRFIADGGSLKKLHRLILTSATYRQSSADRPDARKADPENKLLWRRTPRRLDFEAMRDSILVVSGSLDPAMGGPSEVLTAQPYSRRRSVYGFVDRLNLSNVLMSFDFANPTSHAPRRHFTTVPQQALFLMNSPFLMDQARRLAALSEGEPEARIRALYRRVYGREATLTEIAAGRRFVETVSPGPPTPPRVWSYGYGEVVEGRLKEFHPLPCFTGESWQGSPQLPDAALGGLLLDPTGGVPGEDLAHAVARRWTAPRDGAVSIRGAVKLLFDADTYQGAIRARIVSSRHGTAAEKVVGPGEVPLDVERLEVKSGDTIDFVADCHGYVSYDRFSWAPVLRMEGVEWSAEADFAGPAERPLTPWERYAQVLLETNEFLFVD